MHSSLTKPVTVRLSHEMIAALRILAEEKGLPYQRVMKELLSEALGLEGASTTQTKRYRARRLTSTMKRLKQRRS